MKSPLLIIFGGLPGVGKTTIARAVARRLAAVYLRIDPIEQALRSSETLRGNAGAAGYLAVYRLAEDNLKLGSSVVADSVNPLRITREAWRAASERASAEIHEFEIVCSDCGKHRRRVESRMSDIDGLRPPTCEAVQNRAYDAWYQPHRVLDTARSSVEDLVADVLEEIGGLA